MSTLPFAAYGDPSELADERIQQDKRDAITHAEIEIKRREMYRIKKSRRHRAQVKERIKNGGMR